MTPLDIFKVTLGQVPAIFVVTKTYNLMASQDLSIHVCGEKTGCFYRDLRASPIMFVSTKAGTLCQNLIFS